MRFSGLNVVKVGRNRMSKQKKTRVGDIVTTQKNDIILVESHNCKIIYFVKVNLMVIRFNTLHRAARS